MDTLILEIFFNITKINNFRGDLSDISALKTLLNQRFQRPGSKQSIGHSNCELRVTGQMSLSIFDPVIHCQSLDIVIHQRNTSTEYTVSSVDVLAEISLRSPRKLFNFIMK